MSLEQYAEARPQFRAEVMEHKRDRRLALGANISLYFESRMTMLYQVQEMLRAERIFEAAGIQEEIDAYNPLIPDGSNWKVTMMIEYPDVTERQRALEQMKGIEDRVWIQVADFDRVWAIADEDLDRANEQKTSSVHFLRFELPPVMAQKIKQGASVMAGVDHPAYNHELNPVPQNVRDSIARDLD